MDAYIEGMLALIAINFICCMKFNTDKIINMLFIVFTAWYGSVMIINTDIQSLAICLCIFSIIFNFFRIQTIRSES